MSNYPCCHYCGEPVDVEDRVNVWQGFWGFSPGSARRPSGQRVSGGADLYNRRPFDRWAHAACTKREGNRISARQGVLL
jgi:hypothetical protein